MADRVVWENEAVQIIVRDKVAPPPTPPPPTLPPTTAVSPLYAMVNVRRGANGLGALARDANLERIAQGWAVEMARTYVFQHNTNVARDLTQPWFSYGENIAWGYVDEAGVHQAWLDSDPHRRNIENVNFTHLGVGRAVAGDGRIYWVEVFADRAP